MVLVATQEPACAPSATEHHSGALVATQGSGVAPSDTADRAHAPSATQGEPGAPSATQQNDDAPSATPATTPDTNAGPATGSPEGGENVKDNSAANDAVTGEEKGIKSSTANEAAKNCAIHGDTNACPADPPDSAAGGSIESVAGYAQVEGAPPAQPPAHPPSATPSEHATAPPAAAPSETLSSAPSEAPTAPSFEPLTAPPTANPSEPAPEAPTAAPSERHTAPSSNTPSDAPAATPPEPPTANPTANPSATPSEAPTAAPVSGTAEGRSEALQAMHVLKRMLPKNAQLGYRLSKGEFVPLNLLFSTGAQRGAPRKLPQRSKAAASAAGTVHSSFGGLLDAANMSDTQ